MDNKSIIKKKAQSSTEFLVLFGVILFFFIAFFGVIQKNIEKRNSEKESLILQNVALNVRDEINIAAGSSEGYFREFKIPENIFGKDYNISLIDNFVHVSMPKSAFSYKISNITGALQKGVNNITKKDGEVLINS